VEIEETLGHYAEWAGVPTRQIRYVNKLRFGSVLRLHQRIQVPLNRIGAKEFEQQRYEYHKRLQEDFFTVFRITEVGSYTISPGENYWGLCRQKFDIPLWLLKHYNPGVDLADLRAGQQIIIPEIVKASPENETTPAMEADQADL
jgi:membrane-bound lytic murein transglycosylase D